MYNPQMAIVTITKWAFLTILSVAMKPEIVIRAQQVPCLFIFGDSQFDNGNNNGLISLLKANYLPYGIDFPGGPTGRFSNGNNMADFLARFLGFANPIPPFATTEGSNILRGLNYGSAGAGILDESGAIGLDRFTMNRQLQNHNTTVGRIVGLLGNQSAANRYLQRCLYAVNIGFIDYVLNYYLPLSPTQVLFTPDRFAERLIQAYSQQIRTLYEVGARQVAIFGLTKVGCVPQELALYPTNGSPCVDSINNAVELFNRRLLSLVNNVNSNLPGARFTYINVSGISPPTNPPINGITVNNAACCEVALTGLCIPNGRTCRNRNEYYFYDNYHPTEIINNVTISRAYNAKSPSDAIPVDIQTLARRN